MAKRTYTEHVDDLTGVAGEDVENIQFSVFGKTYEIDLSKESQAELHDTFLPYVEAAREVKGASTTKTTSRRRSSSDYDPAEVRTWAREQGIDISARGRIPADVVESYRLSQ